MTGQYFSVRYQRAQIFEQHPRSARRLFLDKLLARAHDQLQQMRGIRLRVALQQLFERLFALGQQTLAPAFNVMHLRARHMPATLKLRQHLLYGRRIDAPHELANVLQLAPPPLVRRDCAALRQCVAQLIRKHELGDKRIEVCRGQSQSLRQLYRAD